MKDGALEGTLAFARPDDLKADSWTYGDWRQYVWFVDDKIAVAVRISGWSWVPFIWRWMNLVPVRLVAEPMVCVSPGVFDRWK